MLNSLKFLSIVAFSGALIACTQETKQFMASDTKLGTQVGQRADGAIKASGQPGFLVFGPYIPLEPGVYRLVAKGSLNGPAKTVGTIDIATQKGELILATKPIESAMGTGTSALVSMAFEVDRPVTDAEFRIQVQGQTAGTFSGYELTKVADVEKK